MRNILDFAFIHKIIPLYVHAAELTFSIAAIGILLAFVLGIICALIRYEQIPVLRVFVSVYIELSRNTPLLIQLFFLYFALPKIGIKMSSEQCGIIGLTFLGGSYMAETFRSSLETVSAVQIESGECIGLTRKQIIRYVILPQACTVAVPGFCANSMFMIKETSVFSAVALADLMYVAKDLIGLYYKTDEALLLLVISYFILLLPITLLSAWAERRFRYGQFGTI
jgi:polar amino acid transport system permease protein